MNDTQWDPGTVYLRHVDKTGGGYIQEHQCWSRGVFIETQLNAALKEGGLAMVQVVTEVEYLAAKKKP